MKRPKTLPLGIDVGADRVRVALSEMHDGGRPQLVAVAARPRTGDLRGDIAGAARELGSRERRCVMCVAAPDADLRRVMLPPMTHGERMKAARFEAARFVGNDIEEAVVRVLPTDEEQSFAVGVVRKAVVAMLTGAARGAGLRLSALDHAGLALQRALDRAPVVVDIGAAGTVVHVRGKIPWMRFAPYGGRALTEAIAASLGIDHESAERRKQSVGLAGAGGAVRDELVEFVAATLADVRARAAVDFASITLVGNGARLPELVECIEHATAVRTAVASFEPATSRHLPPDVLRAAACDWALAYGLTLWETAA